MTRKPSRETGKKPSPEQIYKKRPVVKKPSPRKSDEPARKEVKYYGVAACQALWQKRPQDVIRIYVTDERVSEFSKCLKWAATERKAYHIVADDDLERLTESVHHQGVCVLALEAPTFNFGQIRDELTKTRSAHMLVYLDGVENPHNLGAVARTCAHFGVRYIIGEPGVLPRMSPSAARVAEGGAEFVSLVYTRDKFKDLALLQQMGFEIVATAAHGTPLYKYEFGKRVVLIMGAEVSGVSKQLAKRAEHTLAIPGSGTVESINVSAAFAVCAGEYFRQHGKY